MGVARSNPEAVNRIPLVIDPENRDNSTNKDARLVNAFMETVRKEKVPETFIYKRPGLLFSSQPTGGAAAGMGIYNWNGDIYSVFGGTFFKNGVSKGIVDTTGGVYQFSSKMGTSAKLQLGNGVAAYNYNDATGLLQINPAGFPTTFQKGWA